VKKKSNKRRARSSQENIEAKSREISAYAEMTKKKNSDKKKNNEV